MRILSLIGFLVVLAVTGVLIKNQFNTSNPENTSMPTEAIEKANEAAKKLENSGNNLEQNLEQP